MSPAEEVRDEPQKEKPTKRQRLKLIDIYTNRGPFSGDMLRGISERVREITLPSTSPPTISDVGEQLPSGEVSGEVSGELRENFSTHAVEKTDTFADQNPSSLTPQFTMPFTPSFAVPPYSSPHDSPDMTPHVSPYDSPHVSPDTHSTVPLTENQAVLYFCLKHLNGTWTSLPRLAQATGISEHTLKSCLKKLRREGLIQHSERKQSKGLTGFSAVVSQRDISLQGDESKLARKLHQVDLKALLLSARLTPLTHTLSLSAMHHPTHHPTHPPTEGPTYPPAEDPTYPPTEGPSCSSSKILLQDLILENVFQNLNPHSLTPYLNQFETLWALQNFLDMANACIIAAKEGHGKPIQNPHGFLFAQLRAGYINPPEGFKSRRVRAQEIRNKQLQEEIAVLQKLKERERELQFELFEAQLAPEDNQRLEQEAKARLQKERHPIGSPELHLRIHKDAILREWFEQRTRKDNL